MLNELKQQSIKVAAVVSDNMLQHGKLFITDHFLFKINIII